MGHGRGAYSPACLDHVPARHNALLVLPDNDYWTNITGLITADGVKLESTSLFLHNNEHTVVIPKLVYAANYLLTSGSNIGLIAYSVVTGALRPNDDNVDAFFVVPNLLTTRDFAARAIRRNAHKVIAEIALRHGLQGHHHLFQWCKRKGAIGDQIAMLKAARHVPFDTAPSVKPNWLVPCSRRR